ncbi:putative extracellular lipase [Pseudomassariella vexata]|uniref:Carboxylic ester hydrolase n=1 Tax=Pseudomassariella vexata TaxID=1141098 RepID=A0A1Y2DAM2_9PEZI|nr:putative extracellular lipase [Pseudomassariella vexata]ORY56156.1 putative extracellular lipase [Pseudomassariella vexata]
MAPAESIMRNVFQPYAFPDTRQLVQIHRRTSIQANTTALEDRATDVTLVIPAGTVVGSSIGSIENFGGIPFAEPATGPLRLKPPVRLNSSFGTVDARGFGPACPQMFFSTDESSLLTSVLGNLLNTGLFQTVTDQTEDCLTMRVQRPAGTAADAKLPVLFWIFGGGFELGSPQMYDGSGLVAQGVKIGKPFIFVSVNYRVGGFGFMPGAEILADGSANLGLLDQRMGLEWTADNIAAFGGDPDKVTIWGESAGAISVFDQMALYNGDNTYNGSPLFRAAIMNSGSLAPADPVDCPKGQIIYDTVVAEAGCSSATDTLECLRSADYDTFLNAANSVPGILSYSSVALSYVPRPDGTALTQSPDVLASNGQYAAVPMIIGNQEDEGTLFALFQPNITTGALIVSYLSEFFFHGATNDQLETLVATYDESITAGSPFRTSIFNNIYPQFKRLAAILGDLVFTLTRRAFLNVCTSVNPDVPAWSYLSSYDYGTPILGTFHGSDLLQVFYGLLPNYASAATQTYYINFLYDLDPNDDADSYPNWPQWTESKQLMQFNAGSSSLLSDDFRADSYDWIVSNIASLYL